MVLEPPAEPPGAAEPFDPPTSRAPPGLVGEGASSWALAPHPELPTSSSSARRMRAGTRTASVCMMPGQKHWGGGGRRKPVSASNRVESRRDAAWSQRVHDAENRRGVRNAECVGDILAVALIHTPHHVSLRSPHYFVSERAPGLRIWDRGNPF